MKKLLKTVIVITIALILYSFTNKEETYTLTIEVKDLRNSKGVIQYALYNKDGSIPDEDYKKYFKILKGEIINGSSEVSFKNLPKGKYAVNILHDENKNGKVDKGLILPTEGIGFSNFQTIGFTNRPNFSKASFHLNKDIKMKIKVIY